MNTPVSVSIPVPCAENWNSFTPTATGGFCGNCQKNVIDFTKATDDEIIAFISRKPTHACGRFRTDQLKAYTLVPPVKVNPGFRLLKAGVVGLILLLMSKSASAQTVPLKTTTVRIEQSQPATAHPVSSTKNIITGVVTSASDSSHLPSVSVVQRNTSNGTVTNADGRFEITIDPAQGDVLVFAFIGMKTLEYKIPSGIREISISLEDDVTVLGGMIVLTGEVSVDGVYAEPQSRLKKFWNKLKNIL